MWLPTDRRAGRPKGHLPEVSVLQGLCTLTLYMNQRVLSGVILLEPLGILIPACRLQIQRMPILCMENSWYCIHV